MEDKRFRQPQSDHILFASTGRSVSLLRMTMKNTIMISAAIGFCVPIFWGFAGFVLFTAHESMWTNLFWNAVYFTCPFWALPGNLGMIVMPFLNAALYSCV